MKKIVILISVLVIGVVAVLFIPDKIEEVVVNELQDQGKRIFGTQVTVSDIAIDVKNGTASISEISIANPQGYSETSAMTLSGIVAKFNYKTAVIDEIIITKPHVFAEFKDKNLNILDLANHAESVRKNNQTTAGGNNTGTQPQETKTKAKAEKPPIVLRIELAALEKASVTITSNFSDKQKQFSIDRLEARNLQGNTQQLADQLVKQLFNDLSRQVIAKSALSLSEDALEKLKDKAKEKLKDLFN